VDAQGSVVKQLDDIRQARLNQTIHFWSVTLEAEGQYEIRLVQDPAGPRERGVRVAQQAYWLEASNVEYLAEHRK
jgi:hypothetical protein